VEVVAPVLEMLPSPPFVLDNEKITLGVTVIVAVILDVVICNHGMP